MAHSIEYKESAKAELDKLPANIHRRTIKSISALKNNPRPHGCKKLTGREEYRIRVGDYRVIYEIHDTVLIVLVIKIAHRGKAYRN
jgi:mRNA interferase RelE/StbE